MQQAGASAAELLAAIKNGPAYFEAYIAAAKEHYSTTEQGVKAAEDFKKALESLAQAVQLTMRDLAALASPALISFLNMMKDSLKDADGLLFNIVEAFKAIGAAASQAITIVVSGLQKMGESLGLEKWTAVKIAIIGILALIGAWASALLAVPATITLIIVAAGLLYEAFFKIGVAMQANKGAFAALGIAVLAIISLFAPWLVIIGLVGTAVYKVYQNWDRVVDAIGHAKDATLEYFGIITKAELAKRDAERETAALARAAAADKVAEQTAAAAKMTDAQKLAQHGANVERVAQHDENVKLAQHEANMVGLGGGSSAGTPAVTTAAEHAAQALEKVGTASDRLEEGLANKSIGAYDHGGTNAGYQALTQPGQGAFAPEARQYTDTHNAGGKIDIQAPPATAEDVSRWGDKSIGQAPSATAEDVARWGDKMFGQAPAAKAPEGHAAGGMIDGPGSTTSDSIFARLSRGEFVTRAAAVQKYGSDFFRSVNDMTFPGFAMGGLVPSPVRMSGGGSGPATSTVNLSIDGRSFGSLRGSKSTVDDLSAFAISRQTSAAGSNPSWMK